MLENTTKQNHIILLSGINEQKDNFIKLQYNENTKEIYNIALTKFIKYLETNQINEIILNEININTILKAYKKHLINLKLANKTINTYLIIVQTFFKNLGIKTTIDKVENTTKTKEYKYLTIHEINKIIETIPQTTKNKELQARNKAIILLMFSAGLRVNELINIKRNDYFKKDDVYYISIIGKGKLTKDILPIAPETSKEINNYLETKKHKDNIYLFSNIRNQKLTRQGINKTLKQIAIKTDKENDLNITPRMSSHVFRHSLSRMLLIDKQLPINQVKDILRHKNIETTIQYLTTSQSEINEIRLNIFN